MITIQPYDPVTELIYIGLGGLVLLLVGMILVLITRR